MNNYKKTLTILLILFLIISYLAGYNLLKNRNWDGVDCERGISYMDERLCKGIINNEVLFFDGIKLLISPIWSPFVITGMIVK